MCARRRRFPAADANARGLRAARQHGLEDIGRNRSDIDRFCCHPGGVKVIEAIETALNLPTGTLDLERSVLNEFGNMSAPTVLFVLARLMKRGLPEKTMLTSFGPGFTCAAMLLERA